MVMEALIHPADLLCTTCTNCKYRLLHSQLDMFANMLSYVRHTATKLDLYEHRGWKNVTYKFHSKLVSFCSYTTKICHLANCKIKVNNDSALYIALRA